MQVHFGLELLEAEWSSSVVCIGTFDGVHLGHQALIRAAVNLANECGLPCLLVTFDRHPAHVLAPDRCPKAVAPLSENLKQFELLGVGLTVVLEFDVALSQTTATDFLKSTLQDRLLASHFVIGHDFAFGKGREGTPEWLVQRVQTTVVPPYLLDGKRVSSSAVRQAITEGRVDDASKLLGRNFSISALVVRGERIGRTLGYPTANLARSFGQVVPADGVYSGRCETPFGTYLAAISIGLRPTVQGKHRTIEAFLIDYPGEDLYGRPVRLEFKQHLRTQCDFDSLESLKRQIEMDVEEVVRAGKG